MAQKHTELPLTALTIAAPSNYNNNDNNNNENIYIVSIPTTKRGTQFLLRHIPWAVYAQRLQRWHCLIRESGWFPPVQEDGEN